MRLDDPSRPTLANGQAMYLQDGKGVAALPQWLLSPQGEHEMYVTIQVMLLINPTTARWHEVNFHIGELTDRWLEWLDDPEKFLSDHFQWKGMGKAQAQENTLTLDDLGL